ncbi:hypothetical protein Syun_007261 [Stephania yunnanensis]|uniref:Uncharacterized protein n=1 Tax=Stephania yunnanensis TaxID=152371 RepID=A0AAP0L0S4_9MAGN
MPNVLKLLKDIQPSTQYWMAKVMIGGRSPNKILFAKNTRKIFQTDFHPAYNGNGMIEFNEPSIFPANQEHAEAFFSHIGVEGPIVSQCVPRLKRSFHLK